MVDRIGPSDPPSASSSASRPAGIGGFISTTTGRIVVGAVALLIVLGALAAIVFLFVLQPDDGEVGTTVPPAGSVTPTGTAEGSAEETTTLRRPKPLASTFVFRDVFVPTVKPKFEPSEVGGNGGGGGSSGGGTNGDGTDGDGTASVPPDTLLLQKITMVDGEPVATLVWNGQTFEAGEGDALGDTPWRVVSISGDSVVLLFGDTRVTLSVGQGISK